MIYKFSSVHFCVTTKTNQKTSREDFDSSRTLLNDTKGQPFGNPLHRRFCVRKDGNYCKIFRRCTAGGVNFFTPLKLEFKARARPLETHRTAVSACANLKITVRFLEDVRLAAWKFFTRLKLEFKARDSPLETRCFADSVRANLKITVKFLEKTRWLGENIPRS